VEPRELVEQPSYHQRYCAFIDILGSASFSVAWRETRLIDVLKELLHNPKKGTE
jgi:hypothetical protein